VPPLRFNRTLARYEVNPPYARFGIVRSQIDPFVRFQSERIDSLTHLREQYIDDLTWDQTWDATTRAIVSYNACHHAKCVNCSSRSIRWNGYSEDTLFRYWKKLVCESCGSVYEIKWAASEEKVRKNFEVYTRNGNFFNCYHAVQAELPRETHAKQYVAMISKETKMKDGKEFWPVSTFRRLKVYSLC
jgi:hypothetical protein